VDIVRGDPFRWVDFGDMFKKVLVVDIASWTFPRLPAITHWWGTARPLTSTNCRIRGSLKANLLPIADWICPGFDNGGCWGVSDWGSWSDSFGGLHGGLGVGVVVFKGFMHAYNASSPFKIVWVIQNWIGTILGGM